MPPWDTIAIIGVGLIGGSVGMAARERKIARKVIGVGRSAVNLKTALERGAIDEAQNNIASGVKDAELVVICTPVEKIAEDARTSAKHCPRGALITDAGSTKAPIVAAIEREWNGDGAAFIGSHPLAGSEKQGAGAATAGLFTNRLVIITPTARSRTEDIQRLEEFWSLLGARVHRMSPDDHDRAVAAISHVPHLVAAALAAATTQADRTLAAAGWLDTTRVAAGDAELWRQILQQNRRHVLSSLAAFEQTLADFRSALETDDQELLTRLLKAGKHARDALGG